MNHKAVLDELIKDLFNEDEMGSVIRAHIRIENTLINIINITAPNPNYIKKLNLDFDGSVTLALLLGLSEEYAKPLTVLGKLRNDFAHKPNMKLSKNEVNNLYKSLNSEAKEFIQNSFKEIKEKNETIRPFKKFSDVPPIDQFRLIVVNIWAQIQSSLYILSGEDHAAKRRQLSKRYVYCVV